MTLRSISVEVHDLDRATTFWRGALGVEFREVVTRGRNGMFGTLPDGVTLKLVQSDAGADTLRSRHVLGVAVADVDAVVELAEELGGRRVGEILRNHGRVHARVRDPDGNELELYSA